MSFIQKFILEFQNSMFRFGLFYKTNFLRRKLTLNLTQMWYLKAIITTNLKDILTGENVA